MSGQSRRSKQERLDFRSIGLFDENGGRLFWIVGGATRVARGQATLLSVVVPAARTAVLLVALVGAVLAGPLEDANEALIQKDYAKAVQLYRPLAAAGNPEAQVNLGYMFDEGLGVSRDYGEAVRWYRFAADQGEPQGLNNLANMYRDGVGVQQDYVQAHLWFNLAAGRFATEEKRAAAAKDRDNVAAKMTAEQIAEAQRLAQHWKSKPGSSPSWWDGLKRYFR